MLYRLSILRDKRTKPAQFRRTLSEIATVLAYEVGLDLPLRSIRLETPLESMDAPTVSEDLVLVSILRAGEAMLTGMLEAMPFAVVGHIGLARDHQTLQPKEYFVSMPSKVKGGHVIVLDPMLATGNSAIHAIHAIKQREPASIKMACVLAAPEGLDAVQRAHPDVDIFAVALDSHLDDNGYIVPGLGDAGDRAFGTL